jgi:hypothetical protein
VMVVKSARSSTARAPRVSRGARRLAVCAVVASVGLVAALVISRTSAAGTGQRPGAGKRSAPAVMSPCEVRPTREACRHIEVGGEVWRYALLRASQPTADTALVDFGGPGAAVLSGTNNLSGFVGDHRNLSQKYNVLVLEEPWVTRDPSPACTSALTDYYRAIRAASAGPVTAAQSMRHACGLGQKERRWGFSAESYARVVGAIADHEALRVRGFVGHSWGAVRLTYLTDLSLDWFLLVRPFPVGVSMPEVVTRRAAAVRGLVKELQGRQPHATTPLERVRSLPVTEFDKASALAELAYLDDRMVDDVGAGVALGQDEQRIALFSDQFWGRYGSDSISPRILSYLDEVCGAAGGWQGAGGADDLERVMASMYQPCGGEPAGHAAALPAKGRACVVTSPGDAVAPEALIRQAFGDRAQTKWVTSAVRTHTSFDGLADCLAELGQ